MTTSTTHRRTTSGRSRRPGAVEQDMDLRAGLTVVDQAGQGASLTVGTLAASTMARAGTRGVASWGKFDARVVQPRGLLFRLPGDDQEEAYES